MLVVVDPEDIPEWLYPGSFPEVPRPPEDRLDCPDMDFDTLWRAIDPSATGDAMLAQSSHCSTGVPHSAPDYVSRFADGLVTALAALPDAERWRVAQAWALARLGKRPNEREMARHKDLLKDLCRLAKRAVETRRPIVLL